jgi:hypothetical protein
MKKVIYLIFLIPNILVAQNGLENFEENNLNNTIKIEAVIDCQFKYEIQLNKYSGLFMCPYLGPKMITELTKINACNINKDEKNQIVIFELDSLYQENDIKTIFLKTIGIPEWSIDNIKLEE